MGIRFKDIVRLQKKKLMVESLRAKGFTYEDIQIMMSISNKKLEVIKTIPIIC